MDLSSISECNIIGRGGYGIVFKSIWTNPQGGREQVAVKRVEKLKANEREEEALKLLNHPNVVKLLDVQQNNDFRYYFLELCEASMDCIFLPEGDPKKYGGPLPSDAVVLLQIASGLHYIHSKKLVHRDIKPENILIFVTGENSAVMKLADFGLSRTVNERGSFTPSGIMGTLIWMALEVLNGQRGTIKSDVFAAGCVFCYYLTKGKHPFGYDDRTIQRNIMDSTPNLISLQQDGKNDFAYDIIQKMILAVPTERMELSEVIYSIKKHMPERLLKLVSTNFLPDGDLKLFRQLLQEGVDLSLPYYGETGQIPLVSLCLQRMCRLSYPEENHLILFRELINHPRADLRCRNEQGHTLLASLCRWNRSSPALLMWIISILTKQMSTHDEVNLVDGQGKNALIHLCIGNYDHPNLVQIIRLLINYGVDVNRTDRHGRNALHYLVERFKENNNSDMIEAFRILVIHAEVASVNAVDSIYGRTPLHILFFPSLFRNQHVEAGAVRQVVQILIENEASVHIEDKEGRLALHYLFRFCNNHADLFEITRTLVGDNSAATTIVNHQDREGQNALHYICKYHDSVWDGQQFASVIRLLIDAGGNVNVRDRNGQSALHYICASYGNENRNDVIQPMLHAGITFSNAHKAFLKLPTWSDYIQGLYGWFKSLIELPLFRTSHQRPSGNSNDKLMWGTLLLLILTIFFDSRKQNDDPGVVVDLGSLYQWLGGYDYTAMWLGYMLVRYLFLFFSLFFIILFWGGLCVSYIWLLFMAMLFAGFRSNPASSTYTPERSPIVIFLLAMITSLIFILYVFFYEIVNLLFCFILLIASLWVHKQILIMCNLAAFLLILK